MLRNLCIATLMGLGFALSALPGSAQYVYYRSVRPPQSTRRFRRVRAPDTFGSVDTTPIRVDATCGVTDITRITPGIGVPGRGITVITGIIGRTAAGVKRLVSS